MKRTLRSRNSCSPIQNIFDKLTHSEFSDLVEVIPPQIVKKLSNKKTILCEDLLYFQMNIKPSQNELQRIKAATKLLKQKCEGGFDKNRKIQDKSTTQNNSFFDCLVNQQEFGRKMVKYETFPIDLKSNHKTNFEYKIEYSNANDDPTFGTSDNLPKFTDKRIETISQQKEHYENTQKSLKDPSTNQGIQ